MEPDGWWEYQLASGPSQAIIKDFAMIGPSPPAEAMVAS